MYREVKDAVRSLRNVLVAYGLLCAVLWFIPLFNILHAESSAVVAGGSFFIAGLSALRRFEDGRSVRRVMARQEAALVLPWGMLTVTLLWVPNCGYLQGLLFFVLFPVTTVVLAVSLAYLLAALPWRRKRTLLVAAGLGVALLTPAYDLGLHPQFYTYNHVFGGVLGPIYDEELALRSGLFAFRMLTLLWAGLFLLTGRQLRGGHRRWERPVLVGLVVLIGGFYVFRASLGINTPVWYLQQALGSRYRTPHFDIYYDSTQVSPAEVAYLAADHEYQYARLAEAMDEQVDERIDTYLYPGPEVKAALTGARYTNVSPVWLPNPQVHVLQSDYADVFPHELVHVFSREFGLPVLNASVSVGLVEGLAVAMEPPSGRPPPHDQVMAALSAGSGDRFSSLAESVASRLQPLGFWTGRGAVSYTTMGSFVDYLVGAYGIDRFKEVYAWAQFEAAYGKPVEMLTAEWRRMLKGQTVMARAAAPYMHRRFSQPSLFERRCPHYVPPFRRRHREGRTLLERGDTLRALQAFSASLQEEPYYAPALEAWAAIMLARGAAATVEERLSAIPRVHRSPSLMVRLGDAYAVGGHKRRARQLYARALERLPLYAHDLRARLALRFRVASRADVLRVLTSGGPPAAQAAQLEALMSRVPAVTVLRALRLYEAAQFERAAGLMRTVSAAGWEKTYFDNFVALPQQLRVWRAETAFRAERWAEARRSAAQAAHGFRALGDLPTARRLELLLDKIRWHRRHASELLAGVLPLVDDQ